MIRTSKPVTERDAAGVERHHHMDSAVRPERWSPSALQGVPRPGGGGGFRAMVGGTRRGFRIRRSASLRKVFLRAGRSAVARDHRVSSCEHAPRDRGSPGPGSQLIRERKDAFRSYQALHRPGCSHRTARSSPGRNQRDELPAGALVGLPVSAGTIEGQARVILDIGRGRTRSGRHPGHRLHRPQLDAPIRRDQRPRDGGWAA